MNMEGMVVSDELAEAEAMIAGQRRETDEPFDIGGLFFDCTRIIQINTESESIKSRIAVSPIEASKRSLDNYQRNPSSTRRRNIGWHFGSWVCVWVSLRSRGVSN
jgi:hypothetical protein